MPFANAGLAIVTAAMAAFALPKGEAAAPRGPVWSLATPAKASPNCYVRCIRYKRNIINRRSCIAVRRTCLGRRHKGA